MELLDLFKRHLASKEGSNSKSTVKNYVSDVRHFIAWFETIRKKPFEIDTVTADVIRLYEKSLGGTVLNGTLLPNTQLSVASMKRHLSSLRKFFTVLQESGTSGSNPFTEIKPEVTEIPTDYWHLKSFRDYLQSSGSSKITLKNYTSDVQGFAKWYEEAILPGLEKPLTSTGGFYLITQTILEDYRERLIQIQQAAPRTINRKLSSLRKYLEFANKQGFIKTDELNLNPVKVYEASMTPTIESNIPLTTLSKNETPIYSKFPPIRLIQRVMVDPYLLFEEKAANIIAGIIAGKPVIGSYTLPLKIANQLKDKNVLRNSSQAIGSLLTVKNVQKEFYAPDKMSLLGVPIHKRAVFHIRYTRPEWYKKYHNYAFVHYVHFAMLTIFAAGVGVALYQNLLVKKESSFAAPTAPPRILSFQGRLTDNSDNPVTTPTDIRFAIYNDSVATGGAMLWEEVQYVVQPDEDGIFSVLLGTSTTIPSTVFTDHSSIYLGVTIKVTPELTPRQRVASVGYATNAEFLQGLAPTTQAGITSFSNVVLALDSSGNLSLNDSLPTNHTFQVNNGMFRLSGQSLYLTTNTGSGGNVILAPDGFGLIDIQKGITNSTANGVISGAVAVNDKFSVLATESAVAAFIVNNNTTGGDIFAASSSGTTKFVITNDGTLISGFYTGQNGVLYGAQTTGVITQATTAIGGQCLQSGVSNPTWGTCGGASYWNQLAGALAPYNDTLDLLVGGQSTNSAKFRFLNNAAGTPIASVSANSGDNATFLAGNGTLGTTNRQTLTIGNSSAYNTTGNLLINPNGIGQVGINTSTILASLDLRANAVKGGTIPVASISGKTSYASLVVDNSGTGDLFAASASGVTNFVIRNNGDIVVGYDGEGKISAAVIDPYLVQNQKTTGITSLSFQTMGGGGSDFIFLNQSTELARLTTGGAFQLPITGGTGGIILGGDTQIYRGAADRIDIAAGDSFNIVNGSLLIGGLTVIDSSRNGTFNNINITGTCTGCLSTANSPFFQANGAIYPQNATVDFLLGGQATGSAKFGVFNLDSGTPTASLSAGASGGTYITADGKLATTANQTLRIGDGNTGNITIDSGSGLITLSDNTNLSGNLTFTSTGNINLAGGALSDSTDGVDIADALEVSGLITANGGLTVPTGQATTLASFTSNGGILYTNGSGVVAQATAGTAIQCLLGGTTPTFGSCATGTVQSPFQQLAGSIVPLNTTLDLLIGGQATASAKFAFLNVDSGTPTASISASSGDIATTLSGLGVLGTTNAQTLTLGNNTTGNIVLDSGSGLITLSDNTNLSGNLTFTSTGNINLAGGTIADSIDGVDIADALEVSGLITANGGLTVPTGQATTLASFTSNGGILYTNGTGVVAQATAGTAAQCLLGGATPTFGSCGTGIIASPFKEQSGAIIPLNSTLDFLVGGQATTSAKFAVLNINSGTPTASISAGSGDNATTLSGLGNLATTNGQTLSLGGTTTGNITLSPSGGTGYTYASGKLVINTTTTFDTSFEGLQQTGTGDLTVTARGDLRLNIDSNNNGTNALRLFGNGNTIEVFRVNDTGTVGIGTVSPSSQLHVTRPLSFGVTGKALAIFDQIESQDIFSASSAGTTRFTLANDGTITASTYSNCTLKTDTSGIFTCGSDNVGSSAPSNWTLSTANGTLRPNNSTLDILIGGTATNSSKFAFLNVAGGTPTASISANSGDIATYLSGNGTLGTTNRQTLTLGNSTTYNTTGNILLNPNGTGLVGIGTSNPTVPLEIASSSLTTLLKLTPLSGAVGDNGYILINTRAYFGYDGARQSLDIWAPAGKVITFDTNSNTQGLNERARFDTNGNFGLGTTLPISELHVTRGLIAGVTGKALAVFDQIENQDIFTASSSGTTRFTIGNSGTITATGTLTGLTGLTLASGGITLGGSTGTSAQCARGGASAAWGSCGASGSDSPFQQGTGYIFPNNSTSDFILGAQATTSAKFAVLNIAGGTPTASLSAGTAGGTFLTADGNLSTTARQSLTIGNSATYNTTGNILINPNGTGNVAIGNVSASEKLNVEGNIRIADDANAALILGRADNTFEGGQINFISAGSYDQWIVDSYQNLLRHYTNSSNADQVQIVNVGSGNAGLYVQGATGIGTSSPISQLSVTRPLSLGVTGKALAIFDQIENQDIFTASAGGTTRFTIENDGDIRSYATSGTRSLYIGSTNGTSGEGLELQYDYAADLGRLVSIERGTANRDFILQQNNLRIETGSASFLEAARFTSSYTFGLGTSSPIAELHVTRPLVLGVTGKALAIFDQIENQDIFTASAAGTTKFTIGNNGNITATGTLTGLTGLTLASGGITLGGTTGTSVQCIKGGASATWGSCGANGSDSPFQQGAGFIFPNNSTSDFLIGGQATTSAKFAVLNIAGGTPTATISGSLIVQANNGNGGKIGIGTNDPQAPLHIARTVTSDPIAQFSSSQAVSIYLSGGSGSQKLWVSDGTDNFLTGTTAGDSGIFYNLGKSYFIGEDTKGARLMLQATTGNVGIGTTTPTSHLTVTRPLSRGVTGKALVIFDQIEDQDIFTASAGGTTRFTIDQNGLTTITPIGNGNSSSKGLHVNGSDSTTAGGGGMTGIQSTLTLTNNKPGGTSYGFKGNITSNSTTTESIYGIHVSSNLSGGMAAGGPALNYGIYSNPTSTGASTGNTNIAGGYFIPSSTNATTGSVNNVYGIYTTTTGTLTTGGTLSQYGAYIANGTSSTTGTTIKYGLYIAGQTGADSNYGAYIGSDVGIGTTTPTALLHVNGGNTGGNAALIVNQTGNSANDIFTASASGTTKFTIGNNGNITATGTLTGLTGLTLASGAINLVGSNGTTSTCLLGGASASWGTCGSIGSSSTPFQVLSGAIVPLNTTLDLIVGSQSSASAKFAVLNVGSGTPTTTVSGNMIVMPSNGAGGQIGVGTISPTARLHSNTITNGPDALKLSVDGTAVLRVDSSSKLIFGTSIGISGPYVTFGNNLASTNGDFFTINPAVGGTGALLNVLNGTSSKFYVDTNGLVGIGTATPITQLQITRPLSSPATGKALVILDQNENQNIFVASNAGTLRFRIATSGATLAQQADTIGSDLTTFSATATQSGTLTTGTRFAWAGNFTSGKYADDTGGNYDMRGINVAVSSAGNSTASNTVFRGVNIDITKTGGLSTTTTNAMGLRVGVNATQAENSGTINNYGLYVVNGTSSTNGTSTKYGLYVEAQTGADNNYGAYIGNSVGIGTTTPDAELVVATTTSSGTRGIVSSHYGNNASGPLIIGRKSRGASIGVDAAVTSGDYLMAFQPQGYVGSTNGYVRGGLIGFRVNGTVADTGTGILPTDIVFHTTTTNGDGSEIMRITSGGNVGIGTSANPIANNLTSKLHVLQTSNHQPAASISATSTTQTGPVLLVTSQGTNDVIVASVAGIPVFRIDNTGGIHNNGTIENQYGDFAEYFKKADRNEVFTAGQIVCMSNSGVTKCTTSNTGKQIIGVVSDRAGYIGNAKYKNSPTHVLVGLVGQLGIWVNGNVNGGDPLTFSSTPGYATAARKAGNIIGYAQEGNSGITKRVESIVQPGYTDPADRLQEENIFNSLTLLYNNGIFNLMDQGSEVIHVDAFSKAIIATLKAGAVEAQKITTNTFEATTGFIGTLTGNTASFAFGTFTTINSTISNLGNATASTLAVATDSISIGGQNIRDFIIDTVRNAGFTNQPTSPLASNTIKTNVLSPLSEDAKVEVNLNSNNVEIKNRSNGLTTAWFDDKGNATIAGQLASNSLQTNEATISGTLAAGNILTTDATVSGTLHANNIVATNIQGLEDKISTIASNLIASNYTGNVNVGIIQAEFGIFEQGITSMGPITSNILTATDQLAVGANFTITNNAINTIGADLEIQSFRQGNIAFQGGLIRMDTDGNMEIAGNLNVMNEIDAVFGVFSGTLTSKALATSIITPLPGDDLTIKLTTDASSNSAKLKVVNNQNKEVLSINNKGDVISSGAATFAKLNFNLVGQAQATSLTEAIATGSAGFATLRAGQPELTIKNPTITSKSLIYITPFGDTNNKVLYLLRQVPQSDDEEGSFTVGVSNPTPGQSIQFNWLIVN